MNTNSNPEDRELIPGDRRKNDPAPTAKMSPLWQVRAPSGGDDGPSDRSALANSDVPARVHPVRSKGDIPLPGMPPENPEVVSFAAHTREIVAIGPAGPRHAAPVTSRPDPPECLS